jgi:hypothetical protein
LQRLPLEVFQKMHNILMTLAECLALRVASSVSPAASGKEDPNPKSKKEGQGPRTPLSTQGFSSQQSHMLVALSIDSKPPPPPLVPAWSPW